MILNNIKYISGHILAVYSFLTLQQSFFKKIHSRVYMNISYLTTILHAIMSRTTWLFIPYSKDH